MMMPMSTRPPDSTMIGRSDMLLSPFARYPGRLGRRTFVPDVNTPVLVA